MAGEAELKIGSESVEKTTAALDSLITVLEKLLTAQTRQEKSNNDTTKSVDAATAAVKQSEIARNKAISLLDLESKGLDKTGDAYNRLKGEILAQEVAAKKNINTAEADYQQILENIAAKEQAVIANKKLVESTTGTTNAMKASEAAAIKATSLYELEQRGLDRLSDEYAELKAEILAKDIALRKGIDTESKEYKQILETTKAQELATARTKSLVAENKKLSQQGTETNSVMNSFANVLDETGQQVQVLDGPLGGIASRMTALSSIIKSGAVAFAALGLAVGAVAFAFVGGVSYAREAEVSFKQLEAQVKVTGGAAGFTAEQFDQMAKSFAMSTLGSTTEMSKLISQLVVFDRVAGQSFTRAIALANDLGATGLTSAEESIKKIGKALQDPLKYYTELEELGIVFNKSQVDSLKSAEALGDTLAAQEVILTALEAKVKGISTAQADSLSGDLDTFGQKWSELWGKAGANALPILRSITQAANLGLDLILSGTETESQTNLRKWREEQNLSSKSTKDLQDEVDKLNKVLDENIAKYTELSSKMDDPNTFILNMKNTPKENRRIQEELDLLAIQKESTVFQKQAASEALAAREKVSTTTKKLTRDQEEFLSSLEDEVKQQRVLNSIFIETGDTRSAAYRAAKAEEDALAIAREKGLEFNKEAVEQIRKEVKAKSDLTESNVAYNITLQKEKAIRGQQGDVQKEIELNKLVANGLQLNSVEYLKSAALIDLRNKALIANEPISGAAYEMLQRETVALVELQVEMKKIAALRQYDDNSSTTKALEKSLELYELTRRGLADNTEEYIREEMAINARNTALQAGFAIGSDAYNQIISQADAVATLQVQLQKIKDIEELGLSFNLSGELISQESLAGLQDNANRAIGQILNLAMEEGLKIDDPLVQKLIEDVNNQFRDSKNQILAPVGLVLTEDGNQVLLSSVEAVIVERDEKIRELDAASRDGFITDELAYQERKLEIIREYEEKANEARVATYQSSAEHIQLIRAKDTADSISAGLANLSAAAGNNKRLAQLSKAAAIFSASVSFVSGLAEANKLPFPANIPAYASALVTGTQIISLASSLNDPSFAFGGVDIQGAGTGRSDSIKANIARGESVVTAPATAQYKETLKRMNAGLPINGGSSQSVSMPLSVVIQGDASENTVRLIDESLRNFEDRVQQISQGVSIQTIQSEQNYGGLLNQF